MPRYLILPTPRHTVWEQKYEDSKTGAEDQLARAGETLAGRQRARAMEIARLSAQLRKAEINVSSLEEEIDQKVTNRIMFNNIIMFLADSGKQRAD